MDDYVEVIALVIEVTIAALEVVPLRVVAAITTKDLQNEIIGYFVSLILQIIDLECSRLSCLYY